jgi:hypothetical protein
MPKLLVTPFADEGLKNSIPVSAEPDALANTASYKKGFPQATMTPVELGGMPPSGKDMNGILHELSSHISYMNKGGQYKFNADFCEDIGGYDIGAIVLSDDGMTEYINTLANNKTNPNTTGSIGWKICSGAAPLGKLLTDRSGLISASGVKNDSIPDAVKNIAKNSAGDLINKSPLVIYAVSRADFVAKQNTPEIIALPDGAVAVAQGYFYERKRGSKYIPDLPGWIPINESFSHFDGSYTDKHEKTIVRCRYHQKDGKRWNITEVINPKPGCVRKITLGEPDAQKKIEMQKLHEFAGHSKSRILLSCDGWTTPPVDGKSALQGLQIIDGEVHRDWEKTDYDTNAAAVWMKNGNLKIARSKDGKNAAKWVAEGALWSASFARGPALVENGEVIQNPDTYLSARAAIGQRADKSLVFLNLEGISGSYGATLQESAQIMADEGCLIAVALDAGGSSQVWYETAYACPSSDGSFQEGRAIPSAIEIIADIVEPYDTGWVPIPVIDGVTAGSKGQGGAAIAYRQRGGDVELRLDTVYSFKANTETIITTEEIPKRFRNQDYRPLRAIACGFGGAVVPWWSGTYISILPHKDTPYTYGYTEWPMPNSK